MDPQLQEQQARAEQAQAAFIIGAGEFENRSFQCNELRKQISVLERQMHDHDPKQLDTLLMLTTADDTLDLIVIGQIPIVGWILHFMATISEWIISSVVHVSVRIRLRFYLGGAYVLNCIPLIGVIPWSVIAVWYVRRTLRKKHARFKAERDSLIDAAKRIC